MPVAMKSSVGDCLFFPVERDFFENFGGGLDTLSALRYLLQLEVRGHCNVPFDQGEGPLVEVFRFRLTWT